MSSIRACCRSKDASHTRRWPRPWKGADYPSDAETLPLILNQWQRAEDRGRSFDYLDRVAELRLRQFDNAAAITLTASFIAIAREDGLSVPADRIASAYFVQGAAELSLGRNQAAQAAYQAGLRLLGMRVADGSARLTLGLLGQVAEHLVRSTLRRQPRDGPREARGKRPVAAEGVRLKAARAYEDLTRIYYFQGDKARLVYATVRATNLAERTSGLSPILVVSYASLGAICGVIPLRSRAERYLALAARLSADIGSPAVDVRVAQMSGLYETSVGRWLSARAHFETGMAGSLELGDRKRWLELAIGLETITNPSFLNPSHNGEQAWRELIDEIIRVGRETGDLHILGCGLTGALRGHLALAAAAPAQDCLSQLSTLMEREAGALEPISRLEAAAFLADSARAQGDAAAHQHWLEQVQRWLGDVNPAMKSRTVAAFVAVFQASAVRPAVGEPAQSHALRRRLVGKARTIFAVSPGSIRSAVPVPPCSAATFRRFWDGRFRPDGFGGALWTMP